MAIKIQEPTLFLRVDKKKKDGRMPIYIRFQRIEIGRASCRERV